MSKLPIVTFRVNKLKYGAMIFIVLLGCGLLYLFWPFSVSPQIDKRVNDALNMYPNAYLLDTFIIERDSNGFGTSKAVAYWTESPFGVVKGHRFFPRCVYVGIELVETNNTISENDVYSQRCYVTDTNAPESTVEQIRRLPHEICAFAQDPFYVSLLSMYIIRVDLGKFNISIPLKVGCGNEFSLSKLAVPQKSGTLIIYGYRIF